jgi:hypothetical protein
MLTPVRLQPAGQQPARFSAILKCHDFSPAKHARNDCAGAIEKPEHGLRDVDEFLALGCRKIARQSRHGACSDIRP